MLELGVTPTQFFKLPTMALSPSVSSSSSAREGDRKRRDFPQTSAQDYCSVLLSVVDVIFSEFFDFLCICSCSLLLSFSLCFSIFSWAFRAFSRDIFISFSFFLTSARSWDDVIPRAFSLLPSSCRSCSPVMFWALNSDTYWSRFRLINQ